MKTRIFFIGSILLITNLVYALPAQNAQRHRSSISKFDYALVDLIANLLVSRGLDRDIAEQKVAYLFGDKVSNAALNLHHFMLAFESVTQDQVVDYLAKKALFDQQIDLGSYGALLSMLQTIDLTLAKTENYEKLQHVARLNQNVSKS